MSYRIRRRKSTRVLGLLALQAAIAVGGLAQRGPWVPGVFCGAWCEWFSGWYCGGGGQAPPDYCCFYFEAGDVCGESQTCEWCSGGSGLVGEGGF